MLNIVQFLALQIWDITKRQLHNSFRGHTQTTYSVAFSSDGRLIVSGSGDGTARIWDIMDGSSKTLTVTAGDGVRSVAIGSDGRLVATGSYDGVCDLSSFSGIHFECSSYRRYISGTFTLVDCWRRCGDTLSPCRVWCSPLMGVDW